MRNKKIKLELWDTPGIEEFRPVKQIYIKNSKITLILYDITMKSSFEKLLY